MKGLSNRDTRMRDRWERRREQRESPASKNTKRATPLHVVENPEKRERRMPQTVVVEFEFRELSEQANRPIFFMSSDATLKLVGNDTPPEFKEAAALAKSQREDYWRHKWYALKAEHLRECLSHMISGMTAEAAVSTTAVHSEVIAAQEESLRQAFAENTRLREKIAILERITCNQEEIRIDIDDTEYRFEERYG
jgi:hypothetical protein